MLNAPCRRKAQAAHASSPRLSSTIWIVDLPATSAIVFSATQALRRKHGLTAYDAAYLEIAIREHNALATVDEDLKRAPVAEGVKVL